MTTTRTRPFARVLAAGGAAALAFGLTACGEDETAGSEASVDVQDVQQDAVEEEGYAYDGIYDASFYDDVQSYVGQEVTLSANVNQVISPMAFTIAGTGDTEVSEMLVVSSNENSELQPDLAVQVTGTVRQAFEVPAVEEELGIELDDSLYSDWEGQPYLVASNIDTSVAADS